MEEILPFLAIDRVSRCHAALVWSLVKHRAPEVVESLYADFLRAGFDPRLGAKTIDYLKEKQKEHWKTLFESRFDNAYFNAASLIGIKHREIGLDVRLYVAAYMKIGSNFRLEILNAPLPLPVKARLIATLDKYIALDMALAVSSYTSVLVD